ncbi:uncharacterized protein LOC144121068 isoform X3 [Amblyomma americanum]
MTAADTKGGDDVSVEVAATGPPGDAATGEPTKEPKCGGSGGDKREYVRRRSSVQQLAHAAWREAAGISAALATGLSISVGGLLIGLVEVIPPVAVSGLRCVCSVLYLLPVIALWRPQLLAEKGCAILEERCGPREMVAGLLVLCGVVVAFLPSLLLASDVGASISGIVITLSCALFQAMAFVILRRLSCQVSPITVSFWTSVATVVLCIPPAGAMGQLRHLDTVPMDLAFTAGAGLTALLTALLPAIACTLAEAGRVAIATTSSVVFSFALQAAVQLKAPTPWAVVGAGFIVAAVVCSNLKWVPSLDILEKLKLKGSGEKDKEPLFVDYGTVSSTPATKSP